MLNTEQMSEEFNTFYKSFFVKRKINSIWETPSPKLIKSLKGEELELARTILWKEMINFEKKPENDNLMNPYIKIAVCDEDKRVVPFIKELYKIYKSKHRKKFSKFELEHMNIVVVGATSEDEKRKVRENAPNFRHDCRYGIRECLDALYSLEHKKIYLLKKLFYSR